MTSVDSFRPGQMNAPRSRGGPCGRRGRRWVACAALAVVLAGAPGMSSAQPAARSRISLERLRAGFTNPPAAARLRCYWWWLNGHTDKATITRDLEEMRAKGFGGALLVDANGANQNGNADVPAGPTFGSPAWMALYRHALREADRLGLEITLNITSGWNLGGPDVTPEHASKLLTWSRTEVAGGSHVSIRLPDPASTHGFYRKIAVLAYPLDHGAAVSPDPSLRFRTAAAETGFSMPDSTDLLTAGAKGRPADTTIAAVRDLSAEVREDGTLDWDAPAGDWEILRIGYTDSDARVSTASGVWQGLAIDYLSRDAFDAYWRSDVEPLLDAAKPFHSLKHLATDSWELGGANWTETFADEFRKRRGYDPVPWLPVVAGRIVGDPDASARFLTDLRRTVADLIVANHYDAFAEHAARRGLDVQAESGGPHGAPIDALETFRRAGVPQTEFWSQNPHRSSDGERFFTKEAASAAHIYGQRFVAQEGETSIGPQWSESLATDLKPSFDMAVTEGMNRLVWHEFTSSPTASGLPGQEYFAGTHLNPNVTWWSAARAFFTYLNRVQFLMQQGTAVDDILYFYGDNVPNFVRSKADDPARVLPGYDYDVTDEDALLHAIHVEKGRLVGPSGVSWRALVLPRSGRLSLTALEQVERLARGGAVIIGVAPTSPTGRTTSEDAARFAALVARLWGPSCAERARHAYGEGRIFCTQNARAVLADLGTPPDVAPADATRPLLGADSTAQLDFVHRRVGRTDVYFVRNGSAQTIARDVLFRAYGRTFEIWDPVTGEMRAGPRRARHGADGRERVPLALPPFGSMAVVFPVAGRSGDLAALPMASRTVALKPLSVWNVSFQSGRGAPDHAIRMSELKSWTTSSDPRVRYFSGAATYRAVVTPPRFAKGQRVSIRFADLHEIARVKINGRDAGTVWAKPLTLRVDPWLRLGKNLVEIEVANLWPNRIIGDLQPGVSRRITQTNITSYHADSPLLPSGLIGPLAWVIEN